MGAPTLVLDSCNCSHLGVTQEGVAEDVEGGWSEGDTSPAQDDFN